jgi:UPF0176 protein
VDVFLLAFFIALCRQKQFFIVKFYFHKTLYMYHVLLFYKFTRIQHPETQIKLHKEVCLALGLKGRVLMNEQGVNGTVGGSVESIELYKKYMNKHRIFSGIDWKQGKSIVSPFPKMQVKYRKEIITTEEKESINLCLTGKHIDRDTFHSWLVRGEDMVLLDMRNDYEWEIGRFVGSVRPPMKYFRDLKDNMKFYNRFKDKKIVMFCTGGIRCEPATAYFIAKGFDPKNIYQLEGGIVKYAEKYADRGYYEGKCFVFDDRMAIDIDSRVVGRCLHCNYANDTYRNCLNRHCNKLFIGCDDCTDKFENTCSKDCQTITKDPTQMRPKAPNHLHRNK